MINLLPPEEKQNLLLEEQKKIIFIFVLVAIIFFTALILILVSVNFSVTSQLRSQNIILENKNKEFEKADIQNMKQEINQANKNLSEINDFYKQKISMTGFLEKISALLPAGIYLNSISVNPSGLGKNSFQVSLSGHADSIDNVLELNEKLKGDKQYGNISFPQDTWLEKQNFSFDVTFQATI